MEYIKEDISRCANHRCTARANCARYLQVAIDRASNDLRIVSVTRFGKDDQKEKCDQHIKAEGVGCKHSCGPSDYRSGGKCDRMGCYQHQKNEA
ncbi:MAG: hypothetical protein RQ756_01805 [Flavobacteriaceae bacterium]|nr:hypothetical protein [Flavobacteriaceae bacterium]